MGFYAAPLNNEADAELESGYTPPSGSGAANYLVTAGSLGKFKYRAPLYTAVNAVVESGYTAPSGSASTSISVTLSRPLEGGGSKTIYATGISRAQVGGSVTIRNKASIVKATGIPKDEVGSPAIRLRWRFVFATHGALAYENTILLGSYSAPNGLNASASLQRYGTYSRIGRHGVANYFKRIGPSGIAGNSAGMPAVRHTQRLVYPSGWNSGAIPSPTVVDTAVKPVGIAPAPPGIPNIFNLRQYVIATDGGTVLYGLAYVQGGVKTVFVSGLASLATGAVTVINTRADQTARPGSIAPPAFPQPLVSPRFIRPTGILGTTLGTARVQFPPQPQGWLLSACGYPTVEYKNKTLRPAGIAGYGEGFPRVADRARKLFHAASPVTAVFGDVQVHAKNFRVLVPGLLSLQMAPWAEVRNTRRIVGATGIPTPGFGADAEARNKTPSTAPVGFDAQQFGRLGYMVVGWRVRSIRPSGVPVLFQQFGSASLWQTPSLSSVGIAPPAVPEPIVWPAIRHVKPASNDMQRVSAPTVWFSYRIVATEGLGVAGASYGTARVEHDSRGVELLGTGFMSFGMSWVSRGLRTLTPVGIQNPLLSLHQIGGTRYLVAEGFEATRWLTRITPENREVFPKTFGAEYGLPTIQNRKRPVFPAGIRTYLEEGQHWGTARVWNLRQIVTLYEDQEGGLWPLPWPQWTSVENRNKSMRVSGFNAARVGGSVVANNARLVQPSGIAYPVLAEYQKTGAVTHRVRPLPLDGIEAPLISRWAVVHNGARPLLPLGFSAILPGIPDVINLSRFYRMQGFYSSEFGYPLVSDRIRTLSFESRYGIQPPRIELPKVHLHTRYLELVGMPSHGVGNAALTIFFRKITPRWTHRDLFGNALFKNRTPEVRTRGRVTEEFGNTNVKLQWRPIKTEGTSIQLFGLARISDRKYLVEVPAANHMFVSDKVTVRRIGEDPVATQYIDLRQFAIGQDDAQVELDKGHGIPAPLPAMGVPNLLKGYIFHGKGPGSNHDMMTMGQPLVSANSVRVESGIFDFYVGEPFVSLRNRRIAALTIGQLILDSQDNGAGMGSWGKPRLSPHTIYAVLEAPPQALRNHGMNTGTLRSVSSSVEFGQVRVSAWNGVVSPFGIADSRPPGSGLSEWGVGAPALTNKRQYIAPRGALMQRIGWPVIPGPQSIFIEESIEILPMGSPSVGPPPYSGPRFINVNTGSFQSFGNAEVDHRNRIVRTMGWDALTTPASFGGSPEYMPQRLTVGPKMPAIPSGFDAGKVGEAWVSHWVRGLEPQGHDSFASEYDLQNFAKRMRVRNASVSWSGRRYLNTLGHQAACVGVPAIRPGAHYIRPDGNSDQYRKGAF